MLRIARAERKPAVSRKARPRVFFSLTTFFRVNSRKNVVNSAARFRTEKIKEREENPREFTLT